MANFKCKKIGKLIHEVPTPVDLLKVIQLANNKTIAIPAGVKFSSSLGNVIYLSDNAPFASGQIVQNIRGHKLLPKYDA